MLSRLNKIWAKTYLEIPTTVFQRQGLKKDDFHGSFLRNLSMKLYISIVFVNYATDFAPHFLSNDWRNWPTFCKKCNLLILSKIIIGLFMKTGTWLCKLSLPIKIWALCCLALDLLTMLSPNRACFCCSAFAILIILIGLLVIMLFLINILIAQLTTTYERSKDNARLEYDISKALFVTRLENSRFRTWVSVTSSILYPNATC